MARGLEPRSQRVRTDGGDRLPKDLSEELRRSAPPSEVGTASTGLRRAIELLERGDPKGAAAEAARVRGKAPRAPSVREVLGISLYRGSRFAEALPELKAYKRMTGRMDQNHLIADCLRALGKPTAALQLTDEALRGNVTAEVKVEAAIVGASALADQGRYPEALSYVRRGRGRSDITEEHTLRLWYVTGDILEKAGRKDEAAEQFRKIMDHDPAAYDVAERLAQLA